MTLTPKQSPGAATGGSGGPGWADAPEPLPAGRPAERAPRVAMAEPPPALPGWVDAFPTGETIAQDAGGGLIRHDQPQALGPAAAARGAGWLGAFGLLGGSVSLLLLGGGALWLGLLLDDLFARSTAMGWLGAGLAAAVGGLAAAAIGREWRALHRLAALDRLKLELARLPDAAPPPAALLRWAEGVALRLPEASAAVDQLRAARTLGEARGLAAGLLHPVLQGRVTALGGQSARQVFIATAVMPAPALDVLAMAVIGLRLMRQVAELHGVRPGAAVLWRLLRRLAFSTGLAVGTDLAVEAGLEQLVEGHAAKLAGGAAGAAVAARRMARLAQATAACCRPL